jgi:hypothetical protein
MVNMTFALDTPIIFPTVVAWETFSQPPSTCPGEPADGTVPLIVSYPKSLLKNPLLSPIEDRVSFAAAIFGEIPIPGVDHVPLDSPALPEGMQRHWPYRNKYGFRRKLLLRLLGVDTVLPTIVYGITKAGAQPNNVGVTNRNIWHSTLAIIEHINR